MEKIKPRTPVVRLDIISNIELATKESFFIITAPIRILLDYKSHSLYIANNYIYSLTKKYILATKVIKGNFIV